MRALGDPPIVRRPPNSRRPRRGASDQEVIPMQLPPPLTRRWRALGRARATPTSNPAAGSRSRRAPRWLAGLALAAALIVPSSASAAAPTIAFVSPSPAEGTTVTTDSVQIGLTYDRKPNATATLVCALSGPTSSSGACDAPVAAGAKGSRSGKSFSGLANGSYTFTATLALTDGGTASATRRFRVDVLPHVYWTNAAGTIGRANLDGTGA